MESMNSQSATARLAKIMRRNETVQVSNVLRPNGEFTKSYVETINCLLDTLAPGSREVDCSKATEELNEHTVITTDDEIVSSIFSLEFQPFTAPGPDDIYPVLLQKGWNSIKNLYQIIFQTCLKYSFMYQKYGRKGLVYLFLNPVKKTIIKLSLSG